MKKLLSLSFIAVAFLFIMPKATAQNRIQKKAWKFAQQKTEQLAKKMDLNNSQKAFATRAIFDYYSEMHAQAHPTKFTKKRTQEEIDQHLYQRISEEGGLTAAQLEKFKALKSDFLKYNKETIEKIKAVNLN